MSAHETEGRERRAALAGRIGRMGLYVVTDDRLEEAALLERLHAALEAGAEVVQFRDKTRTRGAAYALARKVAEQCHAAGALLIVNDYADLAVAIDADGVHVGQDDLPPAAARAVVGPGRIVGLSSSFLDEVRAAATDPDVDYLGFGALFPTGTKPDAEPAGPDMLAQARALISVPIVGIGGVTADNLAAAFVAGADSVAVVSAIFGAPDPGAATRALLAAIESARQR